MNSKVFAAILLTLSVLIAYSGIGSHGFLNYDDPDYVTENRRVRSGLTVDNLKWALTTFHSTNWHPLTWISHMLDCQLFGLNPGAHHWVNVFFHLFNTLLLFHLLEKLGRDRLRSFLMAALFALHPMHVESVAWISERKDLLSTFFAFLSLIFYAKFSKDRRLRYYAASLSCFSAGLMAKPMVVTVPFLMLLMDYWPLQRFSFVLEGRRILSFEGWKGLFKEKLPFFLLTAVSCVLTVLAQGSGGAIRSFQAVPLAGRVENAIVAYAAYAAKFFAPVDLAILYPHPGQHSVWAIGAAIVFLLICAVLSLRFLKSRPWIFVGLSWYIGTLIPVIGIVQVGPQWIADRYTYIPFVGLSMALVWSLPLHHRKIAYRRLSIGAAVLFLAASFAMTTAYLKLWKDDVSLFEHALKVTGSNPTIRINLGKALMDRVQIHSAIDQLQEALSKQPAHPIAHHNLGNAYKKLGKRSAAIQAYRRALEFAPDHAPTHNNLGVAFAAGGNPREAISHFKTALDLGLQSPLTNYNLGFELLRAGHCEAALEQFLLAVEVEPGFEDAWHHAGIAAAGLGRLSDARGFFQRSLALNPHGIEANFNMGTLALMQGSPQRCVRHLRIVVQAFEGKDEHREKRSVAHLLLGRAYWEMDDPDAVERQVSILRSLDPKKAEELIAVTGFRGD